MQKNLYLSVLLIFIVSFTLSGQSNSKLLYQSQKKIALVIGNGNYNSSILPNPENDARSMKVALQSVGFIVMEYENLNQSQMKKVMDDFGLRLRSNEVGLFFYAGHGIQSKGYNYLIPVDAELKSEQQVEYDCIQADRILALMEASGAKVNIIILDACRNNPFERSWTRSSTGKGLAFMNAPRGSLIAYATSPGSTASDGNGNNGLYTSAILESMKIPDLTILEMFQNVRNIVTQKSNNQQTPWESTSLTGNFYFNSGNKTNLTGIKQPGGDKAISTVNNQEENNEEAVDDVVHIVAEEMPRFPGGEDALQKYFADNIHYPDAAKKNKIQGIVVLRFCVTSKGGVNQVSVLKGRDPDLEAEAMRVAKTLTKWRAGRQGGVPVNVWYMTTVTFKLK